MLLSAPDSVVGRGSSAVRYIFKFITFLFVLILLGFASTSLVSAETVQAPFVEPDNQPTGFTATADSSSQITTDWTDSVAGVNAPTGYLVYCSTSSGIIPPTDGTDVVNDASCADGFGAQNVATAVETAVWAGLDPATTYYFEIYAFIGSGLSIDYLTTAIPTADATTDSIVVPATGKIEIVLDTVPNAGRDFSFDISGGLLPAAFDLDDNPNPTLPNTQTFNAVADGTYDVDQTADTDYITTIACVDPSGGTTTSALGASIDLEAGETVTCTFTNTLAPTTGSITIIKDVIYAADLDIDSDTDFAFSSTSLGDFSLDDPLTEDEDAVTNTKTFVDLAEDVYTVTETAVPGWDQSVVFC